MTRTRTFLISILILSAVTAAQSAYFAAFRKPSANVVSVKKAYARLRGSAEPALFSEYADKQTPDNPFSINTNLRSAVYGR